jgi:hypothetical protein
MFMFLLVLRRCWTSWLILINERLRGAHRARMYQVPGTDTRIGLMSPKKFKDFVGGGDPAAIDRCSERSRRPPVIIWGIPTALSAPGLCMSAETWVPEASLIDEIGKGALVFYLPGLSSVGKWEGGKWEESGRA